MGREIYLCFGPEDYFETYLDFNARKDEQELLQIAIQMRKKARNIIYERAQKEWEAAADRVVGRLFGMICKDAMNETMINYVLCKQQ